MFLSPRPATEETSGFQLLLFAWSVLLSFCRNTCWPGRHKNARIEHKGDLYNEDCLRIVIYIALALSIGAAALAQPTEQTTLSPAPRGRKVTGHERTAEPEHPGLKSETWATAQGSSGTFHFLRCVAGPWTMRREGSASSAVLLKKLYEGPPGAIAVTANSLSATLPSVPTIAV